jgi:serine protease Do
VVAVSSTVQAAGYYGPTEGISTGSGFILTENGYVVTNHHVVEGATAVSVIIHNGTEYPAVVVGSDATNDVAVLKVEAEGLTPVILGDSENLNVGDSVVAIGNPLGELTFSLTAGAISALERQITMSTGATMNLMQTDCAINSGNSGGALFNLYGEVIGITNAKYSSNGSTNEASIDNIGFAIPMNHARKIVESIIEKGYFSKPYIGVSVTDVSQETQSYGLPQGAAVKTVAENSPAQQAGLQVNDIITHVGEKTITGSQDLVGIVGKANVGDTLQLKVYRQGTTIDITITVGEQIRSANTQQQGQPQQNTHPFPNWGY